MTVELFKLDTKTRMVDMNREWISTIKEFKKILVRIRSSKGDSDGRRKIQAEREFTFIYHYCDYKSQFGNYSEENRLKESIKNAELPEDFDFKKDAELVEAIKRYKELQETPSLKILNEAKEGLHTAHKVVRKIRTSLETQLEAVDFDELTVEEDGEGNERKTKITDPVTKLTQKLQALMKLTNEIGPTLKAIKELEEEVKKELGEKQALRGGKEKGIKEDGVRTALERRQQEDVNVFDDL